MAAVSSRGGRTSTTELQISKRWKERETSPERTKVWTEPPPNKLKSSSSSSSSSERRQVVPVVYYLTRNGQLEHPHFMEVTLPSSSDGLYLRDVINRLNLLRGKGMASMYSWSSKRSYKNGFVWHDLAENDFIHPAHGQEYVLKGSELLLLLDAPSAAANPASHESATMSSSGSKKSPETHKSGDDSDFPITVKNRRRNQSWSSIDLHEYKVYKTESTGESIGRSAAANASTQTDDKRRRRKAIVKEVEEEEEEGEKSREAYENHSVELSREEISPPPSDSSPETLETLMKADGRLVLCPGVGGNEVAPNRTASNNCPSGRMKASSVLMQLISCGAVSFKDCGAMAVKDQGFSLISHYKSRFPRGAGNHAGKDAEAALMENPIFAGLRLEDKEYFSGSLIETKKDEFPSLKRSSSYNADRSSQMGLALNERDGVRAKCIPRKSKTVLTKKEANNGIVACNVSGGADSSGSCSSQHGSKRLEVQQ